MATLRDLSNWIESTLGGDTPRVNSLVKLVRGEGLFSSGGRGLNAPKMSASDFATAVACSLTTAAPTKAAHDVRTILDLRAFSVHVDNGDGGGFREYTVWDGANELPVSDEHGNRMLPPELSSCPATLGDALSMWVDHFIENPADDVMNWDRVSLHVGANTMVEVELYNPNWSPRGWGTDGGNYSAFAWRLRFEADETDINQFRRTTVTTLYADALQALAELARRDDAPSPEKE